MKIYIPEINLFGYTFDMTISEDDFNSYLDILSLEELNTLLKSSIKSEKYELSTIINEKIMKNKAVFKFNNGNGALLCSKCSVIIKTGKDFTEDEHKAMCGKLNLEAQYCSNCKENENKSK